LPPVIPPNENERLEAVRRFEILDTPPEPAIDNLVNLAAEACGVPMAAVALLDSDRCWYKSRLGIEQPEISR